MKLRSRLASALVSAVVLASAAAPAAGAAAPAGTAPSAPFKDVAGMSWALPSIQAVSLLGVMQGTGAGLFDPSGTTTRAELAVVMARLLRWPTGTQGSQVVQGTGFNDWSSVPEWARTAVAVAASRGILQGESDGGVHPNAPVTWAQLAVIAARSFGYPAAPANLAGAYRATLPASAATPAWALAAVAADVQAGNFGGILGALYRPNQPVSRAALAVFLTRAAGAAGNPDFLTGRIAALASAELVLQSSGGVSALPVAGDAAVYAGSAPSTLSAVQVGDRASVVLVGGQAAWIDVTSLPAAVTVAGDVASVGASGVTLTLAGGGTVTLPASPTLSVTVAGSPHASTIASLMPRTPVLATLDGRGQLTAVEVTGPPGAAAPTSSSGSAASGSGGTPAPSGSGSSSTSGTPAPSGSGSSNTSGTPAPSGSGSSSTSGTPAPSGSGSSSTSGTPAPSGSGSSAAGSATAATTVTALDFSPDPIAANASLSAGSTVGVVLAALNAAGDPVPGAVVQLSFSAGPGGGSASVGGTLLTAAAQSFVADRSGDVRILYRAPAAPSGAGSDALVATSVTGDTTVAASDSYVFQPYPSSGGAPAAAVASYTFAPSPIAPAASIAAGQSVNVTLTAEDATGGPVGTSIVYLSFAQGHGGGTAWVKNTALTSTPQAFLTDPSGHVAIVYTAPSVPPSGTTDTITAANAAAHPTLTASDTYGFASTAAGVAPYGTFTALVQSVGGTGLQLLLPGGSTASLILAPNATIERNGQPVGVSGLAVGDQVTVTLNGQEWIDSVEITQASGSGGAPVAGYLTSVDSTAGTITIYGSGGLHTYWLGQQPSVTLAGQSSQVAQIPVGDSLSLTLDPSSFVTSVTAAAPAQVTRGQVATVVANVLTLSSGSTSQSIVLGQYTVAVRGGQLVSATALPPGTQVVIVPGAATYGGMLIIATS